MLNELLKKSGWPRNDYTEKSSQLLEKVDMAGEYKALLFGCSDGGSPELFLAANPRDLLVYQNAGNIIPPYEDRIGSVSIDGDFLEDVVTRMHVPHIVVCGHADCGFIKTLDAYVESEVGSNLDWLRQYALPAKRIVDARNLTGEERHRAIVEQNVLQQLDHLKTYPPIIEALEAKRLKLHGWFYSLRQWSVSYYDWDTGRFIIYYRKPASFDEGKRMPSN